MTVYHMNTVSYISMAMGTDKQKVIHPFFQQEFGITLNPTPTNEPILTSNAHANEPQSIDNRSSASEEEREEAENYNINQLQNDTASAVEFEDDPNESRRKRRRTDKTQATEPTTSRAALTEWLGMTTPTSSSIDPLETEMKASISCAPPEDTQPPAEIPPAPADNLKTEGRIGRTSARQKTLKLSSKGGFLSSPAASPPPDSSKKTTGKRRRPRKGERMVVRIKYTLGTERNIGKLIDDILNGQVAHKPPATTSTHPLKIRTQTQKPTHPFFKKKPSRTLVPTGPNEAKPETPDSSQGVPAGQPQGEPPVKKRIVAASGSSFTRPLRRVSKFMELVDPIWPPRDLVHVRDLQSPPDIHDCAWHVPQDQKKSKIATISIRDEENVLLAGTAEARRVACLPKHDHDYTPILRHPVRHVASSQVLHTAMERQMSWSSPNRRFPWNSSSPPLARLRSAVLTSVSAFDCGVYETQLWTHKYAPQSAQDVLQLGREPQVLRDWLRHLKITAVDTGSTSNQTAKPKSKKDRKNKKRQKVDKLDGFIVSSEEEASEMDNLSGSDDELAGGVTTALHRTLVRSGDIAHGVEKSHMANAILLSGPAGCGKTASVYAVAKELDFEVFEINPGSRRSARDMLERVGDMTQNHLVHLLNESENHSVDGKDAAKQNKLMNFFKGPAAKASKPGSESEASNPKPDTLPKRSREQKQSLILLEEADLLFEEDRQFWTGVLTLISQSKRPIIITCNDESLIPTQDMSLHAILRYHKPAPDFGVDYLLLVAANEGHMLKREAVTRLYQGSGLDLRQSLMDLTFWCQMGVGSEKAGLDWLLPNWPPGSNVDQDGDRLRVLSLNTYERYMGWFNRDMLSNQGSLDEESELVRNSYEWWQLGLQDSEDMAGKSNVELLPPDQFHSIPKTKKVNMLSRQADYYDMRSSLDILCSNLSMDMSNDPVDISTPPPPEGFKSNYPDNYPLLHTDLRIEHSSLSKAISTTFDALISRDFRPRTTGDLECSYANRALSKAIISAYPPQTPPSTLPQFQRIFEVIMRANYSNPTPTARHAPSFENGVGPITEDLAPYIRGIMVFDGRLHQYRERLYALTAQENGRGEKRSRTTRASRAALEGGDKASTRKERWFPLDTPYYQVQNTAGRDWQDVLFRMGYFHVQPLVETSSEGSDRVPDDRVLAQAS